MAVFYITEWTGIRDSRGAMQAPYVFIKKQTVAIGSEAKSGVFDPNCALIEIACDAICSFVVGPSPTATATDMRIPADTHSKFIAVNGDKDKLSVIANT